MPPADVIAPEPPPGRRNGRSEQPGNAAATGCAPSPTRSTGRNGRSEQPGNAARCRWAAPKAPCGRNGRSEQPGNAAVGGVATADPSNQAMPRAVAAHPPPVHVPSQRPIRATRRCAPGFAVGRVWSVAAGCAFAADCDCRLFWLSWRRWLWVWMRRWGRGLLRLRRRVRRCGRSGLRCVIGLCGWVSWGWTGRLLMLRIWWTRGWTTMRGRCRRRG